MFESLHDKIKLRRDGVRMLRGPRCYSQKQFSMLSVNFRVNLEVFARGLGVRIILMIVLIHDFFFCLGDYLSQGCRNKAGRAAFALE